MRPTSQADMKSVHGVTHVIHIKPWNTGFSQAPLSSSTLLICPQLIHFETTGNERALVSRSMPSGQKATHQIRTGPPLLKSPLVFLGANTKHKATKASPEGKQPPAKWMSKKEETKWADFEVRIHFLFCLSGVEKEIGSVVIVYTYTSRKCQRGGGGRTMRKKLRYERPRFPAQL